MKRIKNKKTSMKGNMVRLLATAILFFNIVACKQNRQEVSKETIEADITSKVENDVKTIIDEFKNVTSQNIMVIAHRGDWRNSPENSLQAIKNCIDMGVDVVELDVRATKDGHLVLMHDSNLERTTTGKGKVSEWTLDSLKTLHLKNGVNHPTHYKIPTLEEAMQVAKGKIMVNLDKCYYNFDKVYEVLQKTGTTDQVIMKGKVSVEQIKEEFGTYLDKVYFMPVVDLGDEGSEKTIEDYRNHMKPIAYELVFANEDSPVLKKLNALKKEGSRIWVNALWDSLNAGYEDDLALIHTDSIYGWYVKQGINMIQTDRPELLLSYLRKQGLHR